MDVSNIIITSPMCANHYLFLHKKTLINILNVITLKYVTFIN